MSVELRISGQVSVAGGFSDSSLGSREKKSFKKLCFMLCLPEISGCGEGTQCYSGCVCFPKKGQIH